MIVMKQWFFQN